MDVHYFIGCPLFYGMSIILSDGAEKNVGQVLGLTDLPCIAELHDPLKI